MARTERERQELRERTRALLARPALGFTVDLSKGEANALDVLLDALLELVLQQVIEAGGFCNYEWHIAGADFGGYFVKDPDVCQVCRKPRAEHVAHAVLLCPDELEHVQKMDADQNRGVKKPYEAPAVRDEPPDWLEKKGSK